MLPVNIGGHSAYQDTFVSDFLKFYPDPFALSKSTWDYIVQFWYLDLSMTDSILQHCYSIFGPEPRLPSCMQRSYLLALKLKVTSIGNVISSATTSTCMWPPIPIVTFSYSLF